MFNILSYSAPLWQQLIALGSVMAAPLVCAVALWGGDRD
jgi:hypothetical protein